MGLTKPASALLGRGPEQELIARQLDLARGGQRGLLVIRGEPGIGKTALVDDAARSAAGLRVARIAGTEAELELPYASLHQLCGPLLGELAKVPGRQRDALGTAFGLSGGPAPDRAMVGLATLSLLSAAGGRRPLLCAIDDLQWVDRASAQVLAFVARRLLADPVALIFATRDAADDFTGLPELRLGGLAADTAQALLDSVIRGPLDHRVRTRILAEAHGNPLALLELPGGPAAELVAETAELDIPARVEESFRRRIGLLSPDTQRLLLIAAAEPAGDPGLLWRAAGLLGTARAAAAAAQEDGLLAVGERVLFHHPLVRSAVYRTAAAQARRAVHGALARATDAAADPDRQAWHRALAAAEPDEEVAAGLERSADRARARGGIAAAAAFLERATILTPEPGQRTVRALAAAQARQQSGAFEGALTLLAAAEARPLDPFQRAQADLVRGQIAFATSHWPDATPLLLAAARRLEPLDARMSRDTYLKALTAAHMVAGPAADGGLRYVAAAARAAPPATPPYARDLLLDGLATLVIDGNAAGTAILKRALRAYRDERVGDADVWHWIWEASNTAAVIWDDESWQALTGRCVRLARELGALSMLPIALGIAANERLFAGDPAKVAALAEEAQVISRAIGARLTPYGEMALEAWHGREATAVPLLAAGSRELADLGDGSGRAFLRWATAILYNGLGRYEEALTPAEHTDEYPAAQRFANWVLPELIEAAVRCGQAGRAAQALDRLSTVTRACGTDWALGTEARSRALLSDGATAERLYREAVTRLDRTTQRPAAARARLLYGEWLRRQRRRSDARDQLRQAHVMLTETGLDAFAERARIELEATGERARRRTTGPQDQLTPQETQIARMAAGGATNAEIAAQLFLSPNTVSYHLRTMYGKLGIATRRQLAAALEG